jgi:predicted permease
MQRQVSPGYFGAMGIPLLRGRLLEPGDTLGREPVVVVDKVFADKFFPGADPTGKRVRRGGTPEGPWSTIVGVIGTIKHWQLDEPVAKETLYFAYAQNAGSNVGLIVKANGRADLGALLPSLRQAVLAVDREQPVFDVKTMSARIDESLQAPRTPMVLLTVFAAVALLLASLGIYGVLAFSVGQRTNEIGVRMALGANRRMILGMILRQGLVLVAIGLAIGLGGYFALGRLIQNQLFNVAPTDPATLIAAPAVLALVALLACLLPARRATRVDPMIALRAE